MLDRRHAVVSAVVVVLLVAGATLLTLPRAAFENPQEALEPSSASPIASAVDAGAASALVGLLPTSDLYARVQDVVGGLKAGIPLDAPALSVAQLDLVTATARGAAGAAIGTDAGSTLTGSAHAALASESQGLMAALVETLPATPDAGSSAMAQAFAASLVAGSIGSLDASSPHVPSNTLGMWAQAQADRWFRWIGAQGTQLDAVVGSPALTDVTTFAAGVIQAQLDAFPYAASQQQLDALGAFAGGEVVGIAQGDIASFPSGAPAPNQQELQAWFDGVATGHQGTPPWDVASDGAVEELASWAQALAEAAPPAVLAGPDLTPTQGTLSELSAWGRGLAQGGYQGLAALPGSSGDLQADAQAYAQGLAGPGVSLILGQPGQAPISPALLQAYAASLTSGAGDLRGAAIDSTTLEQRYLGDLAGALSSFPSFATPAQAQIVQAFGAAATQRLVERLDAAQNAAVPGEDPQLLDAMLAGMTSGLTDLVNGTASGGSAPPLTGALTTGLIDGFLESKDPQAIWGDASTLTLATRDWYENALPAALFGPVLRSGAGAAGGSIQAVQDFGEAVGGAPVEWAAGKGANLSDQAFDSIDDVVWISSLAQESVNETLPTLVDPTNLTNLNASQLQDFRDAVDAYASQVSTNATNVTVKDVMDSLDDSTIAPAADAYAKALLAPVGWIKPTFVDAEAAAAHDALDAALSNASTIRKFADAGYVQNTLALLGGVGDGVARAEQVARSQPSVARQEGNLTEAWIGGVVQPVLAAPVGPVRSDVHERAAWISAATSAAILATSNATRDQANATRDYASSVTQWLLEAPGRPLPNVTRVGFPLLAWTHDTVQRTLESLPPTMPPPAEEAIVDYATGIAMAITHVPTPDVMSWTAPQLAAMAAYVGGLSAAAPTVLDDVQALLNATACEYTQSSVFGCGSPPVCSGAGCGGCGDACGGGGNSTQPCDPACAATETYNETARYGANVQAWSENATASALDQMPSTSPTTDGILVVQKWADDVLGDHGIVVNTSDPTTAWQGPRGPPFDFASARLHDVMEFGQSMGDAYAKLVNFTQLDPASYAQDVAPMADPLVRWEAALQDATAGYFTDPRHAPGLPDASQLPALPPAPPADPTDRNADRQWVDALFASLAPTYAKLLALPISNLSDLGDYGDQLDYLTLDVIARQGADAAFDAGDGAIAFGSNATATGPLDAYAEGLVGGAVASANGTLVQPGLRDSQSLLAYYAGVAYGGVDAIASFSGTVTQRQIPALEAFAATLSNASWLPPPPLPQPIASLVAPSSSPLGSNATNASSSGSGGGPTGSEDPQQQAMDNLQAHAAGLASAALAVPLSHATLAGATGYPASLLAYLAALRDSGALIPPVAPDPGYPARLRAWADAESYGALANPPNLSPQDLAPNPNLTLAVAYVKSFAGASAWSLVDAQSQQAQSLLGYATAAVGAAPALACPTPADPSTCAGVGSLVGGALGSIALTAAPLPVGPPDVEGIAQGLASGIGSAPGVGVDPAAELAIAEGVATGLLPSGVPSPAAATIANATASAVLAAAPSLPTEALTPLAQAIAAQLAAGPQAANEDAALASGAAAYVAAALASGQAPSADHVQALVLAFLAPNAGSAGAAAEPAVMVSDGRSTIANDQLDGSVVLAGLSPNLFRVTPPQSAAAGTWELLWSGSDPTANGTRVPLQSDAQGSFAATLSPSDLAGLQGSTLRFVVQETLADGQGAVVERDGQPFAYAVDRDSPAASVSSPAQAPGNSFTVTWSASDPDSGIASYRVEVQDGSAAWRDLLGSTTDTAASFTGQPGHAYSFRVTATDLVGQTGAPSAPSRTLVPATAPADHAPGVSFVAPEANATYSGPIPVALAASDPEGTSPIVKVCVRRAGDASDFACPYEGSQTSFRLNVTRIPDGSFQLHAVVTDGTLSANATSAPFALDRAPPRFLGAAASLVGGQDGLVTAGVQGAGSVHLDVLGAGGALVATRDLNDAGRDGDAHAHDGVWTAALRLAAGSYQLVLNATAPGGEVATLSKSITVPAAPQTGAGGSSGAGGATAPSSSTPNPAPPARHRWFLPGPEIGLVALAVGLLAAFTRRRRS